MSARALPLLAALAMTVLGAGPAHAAPPCETGRGGAGIPIRVPLGAADFGVLPEACAATSLSLETRGSLAIATDDYYGALLAGGSLRLRWAFVDGSWLSIALPGVEARLVANASLQPTSVDLGGATAGAHFPLPLSFADDAQVTPYVRLLVPTESVLRSAVRTGVEIGHSLVWNASRRLELTAGVALPMVVTSVGGRTRSSFVPALSADVAVRPARWLTVAAGLGLRLAVTPTDALESVDPRLALRLSPWPSMNADLSVVLPALGHDRTDVAALLSLAWLLEEAEGGS